MLVAATEKKIGVKVLKTKNSQRLVYLSYYFDIVDILQAANASGRGKKKGGLRVAMFGKNQRPEAHIVTEEDEDIVITRNTDSESEDEQPSRPGPKSSKKRKSPGKKSPVSIYMLN